MLTGGWVEVTYLSTKVYKTNPDEKLQEAIADQKFTLDRLLLVLDVYQSNEAIKELTDKMKELRDIYDKVNIEKIVKPAQQVKTEDGTPQFVSEDITIYNVTDEDIAAISEKVTEIREIIVAK